MVGSFFARAAARIAWSMWGVSLALTALGLFFLALNTSHPDVHVFDYWVEVTVLAVTFSTVGAVITSRRPENPIGWLFCATGVLVGVDHLSAQYAIYALLAAPGTLPGGEALAWIRSWIWVPHFGLVVFLGLLFPDGRLPASRWRPFAWFSSAAFLAGTISVALSPGPVDGLGPIRNPLGIAGEKSLVGLVEWLMLALALVAAASLFGRLRSAEGEERQQLKWFVYAAAMFAMGTTLTYAVSEAMGVWWVRWVGFAVLMVGLVGLPTAVGIAILKYHLYDIDHLINRTLVYGALTVMLALVYVSGIVLLQGVFRALTGQESQLAVVASTLLIATLFSPLRRRIQSFIDRRFYRRTYDARKMLEAFAARLRDETDLEALSGELVATVRETMQPARVSLWLREPVADRKPEENQ